MKAAPPIKSMEVMENSILKIVFAGMKPRYVDLHKFPLLGVAKRLGTDENFLKSFQLVDGVPEWNGQCLLGPEDLLEHSAEKEYEKLPIAGSTKGSFLGKVKNKKSSH